jgi:isocitrate dehydrogenase (NAD+)
MMLDHVGRGELALRVRKAIDQTLKQDKILTGDLGGKASTAQYAKAVVARLS